MQIISIPIRKIILDIVYCMQLYKKIHIHIKRLRLAEIKKDMNNVDFRAKKITSPRGTLYDDKRVKLP